MFGIGFGELLVIGVVAIIVFGPDRLPQIARQAGEFVRTGRQLMLKARQDLAREMGDDYDELRRLAMTDPRRVIFGDDPPPPQASPSAAPPRSEPLSRGEVPPFDREAT